MMKDKPLTFEQGYICAVATLLRQHGESVCARDLLSCAGNVDWKNIESCDRDIIKKFGLIKRNRKK